jgi:hypothetical protein
MTRATRWFLGVAVASAFFGAGAPSCDSGSTPTEINHCCSNGMYYSCTSTNTDCPSKCSVVESKSATCQTGGTGGGGAGGAGGASPK